MPIILGPRIVTSPVSASTVAVDGDSLTMRQSALAFMVPSAYRSTYTRSMLETP